MFLYKPLRSLGMKLYSDTLMCSVSVHCIIQKTFKHQQMHKEFIRQL
jgi:hypothetical protein